MSSFAKIIFSNACQESEKYNMGGFYNQTPAREHSETRVPAGTTSNFQLVMLTFTKL